MGIITTAKFFHPHSAVKPLDKDTSKTRARSFIQNTVNEKRMKADVCIVAAKLWCVTWKL